MKASDTFQAKDSGRGTCTSIVFGKHRAQERVDKQFQAERAPRSFQRREEEVERGKG
jgi:hypothetical protein